VAFGEAGVGDRDRRLRIIVGDREHGGRRRGQHRTAGRVGQREVDGFVGLVGGVLEDRDRTGLVGAVAVGPRNRRRDRGVVGAGGGGATGRGGAGDAHRAAGAAGALQRDRGRSGAFTDAGRGAGETDRAGLVVVEDGTGGGAIAEHRVDRRREGDGEGL